MPATLSKPTQHDIEGFADVEAFATEHDLTDSLLIAYEIICDVFPMAERIHVEHYTDPEDGHESLIIVFSADLTLDQAVELDLEWNRRVCRALEPDALWRIGMLHEFME